ncbi:MAG: asparagine synthase C-terminal domain-containing protein [Prochlorococcus marinus XMU1425]|nr:asparagine synthase C-terminal domain-containing protein [Prochlorococcus marinus XMU1425]MCR8534145.1 asparagine synthase C-terminal domain-containing protein [Prochlorococcus marinus XMU1426]
MKISSSEIPYNQETFFKLDKGEIIKSNDIRELVNNDTKISPIITQIFDVYGSRIPYPFTIFDGIFRVDKRNPFDILVEDNKISLSYPDPLNKIDREWNINNYFEVLSEAVKCNTKYAAVFLSSGWDSSSIVASLAEKMPSENIKTFTQSHDYGEEKPFNIYELNKVKKICNHYGIENILVPGKCDKFNEEELDNYFRKSSVKMLFSNVSVNHSTLWDSVIEYGFPEKDTTIYAGEYSDGAHNFGFSQNFGALYPEKGLREYGDKIRNYFLSPSFFKRLITEKNLENDFLVKNFAPAELMDYRDWDEGDLMLDLIKKVYIDDARGPFIFKSVSKEEYKIKASELISNVIFKNDSPESFDQWYSLILRHYNNFHWSGSTVKGISLHNPGEFQVKMPFGDEKLLKVLEEMPTKFGRGLELCPTKYPLKKYCELKLENYPFEVQEGHHSYLYDEDQSLTVNNAFYKNTALKNILKKSWKQDNYLLRREFLQNHIFDKYTKEINSNEGLIEDKTIMHAISFHMLDQFLEYSGYKTK